MGTDSDFHPYIPFSILVSQLLTELSDSLITRCLLQLTLLQSVTLHNVIE